MKILLCGCTGAMGRKVTEIAKEYDDIQIVCGYADKGTTELGYPVYTKLEDIKEKIDIILDFSFHTTIKDIVKFAKELKLPLAIATTGHTEEELRLIRESSKEIPIFQAGNTSQGVYALLKATEILTNLLRDFDIEVVEMHHNQKKDAPSGTAKMIVDSVKKIREELEVVAGRDGETGKRDKNEIGVHALRGGSVVGEHSVIFAGLDEIVEVRHTALSKGIFANGALKVCRFLIKQKAGFYTMNEVNQNKGE